MVMKNKGYLMQRRKFVKVCSLSTLGLLAGCKTNTVKTLTVVNDQNEAVVKLSDFAQAQHVVIDHPDSRYSVAIFRSEQGEYVASLMECTHQSCQLGVVENRYVCPCHGSQFNSSGRLIKGPAEEDLQRYFARVSGDLLYIKFS